MEQWISESREYEELKTHPVSKPIISIDDCHVTVSCEQGSELVIFDDIQNPVKFGEYSAEGICDSISQKWQVDDGNGFNTYDRMIGICVDYSNLI
uniref:Phage protein n=1 Tax=Caenorhabditis tropicalis TaxID=1561998 RepID=A0A1I7TCB8_9PELO